MMNMENQIPAAKSILLFGISNVGKTTVGQLLAAELGYKFYDLDEETKLYCHMTLEEFVNTISYYERDKIRENILDNLLSRSQNKVIAVTPMYYSRCFNKYLTRDGVLAIELQDTPENIFSHLIFGDENDHVYKDDAYRDAHRSYYLREIKKDITYYKRSFAKITNKFPVNNAPPSEVVQCLLLQYGLMPDGKSNE